ncbi:MULTISPECIES: HU family DNA-binding protein [Vibrio]|uniref:HU family DNA-binding protein n=1 Tax=Vibrio TaxID=662 RepID=UPI001EEDD01E|nr:MULTISPECIES: HU family DNA-binding protein [Vibrio]MDW1541788.1 HU family DNA-binding protein [Vibrio sp. YT-17]MDW1877213.1 HU family DNA-binding protein [Vibrio sp. Vb1026]MDW2082531.1 HU family DNA-binding protein [Vibrio sp. 1640]MDW3634966.1 HU family DNA-binding protein [Vibrio sp. Vb0667]ULF99547.1 HU family DNA-binding protein [Vibrio alginolyticus]
MSKQKAVGKHELISAMKKETGALREECELVFDAFIEEISTQTMIEGNAVLLSGFGTFAPRLKKARAGRNPKTGTPAIVAARDKLTFSASDVFRDELANKVNEIKGAH